MWGQERHAPPSVADREGGRRAEAVGPALAGSIAGDAVSGTGATAGFPGVDLEEFAGAFALIAARRLGWCKSREPAKTQLRQPARDGGRLEIEAPGDIGTGEPVVAPQTHDQRDGGLAQATCNRVRRARSVLEAGRAALPEPGDPFLDRASRDADGLGDLARLPARLMTCDNQLSKMRRGSGIPVRVHGGLPGEGWRCNHQLPGFSSCEQRAQNAQLKQHPISRKREAIL